MWIEIVVAYKKYYVNVQFISKLRKNEEKHNTIHFESNPSNDQFRKHQRQNDIIRKYLKHLQFVWIPYKIQSPRFKYVPLKFL